MIKSMTGFGKAECKLPTKKLTIELKSLNSKQVDTNTRLPAIYKEKELEIRQILASKLERGKIDCSFHYEIIEGASAKINTTVIKDYFKQLEELNKEIDIPQGEVFSTLMRLPDTVISEKAELEDAEWQEVKQTLLKAVDQINEFRSREGQAMETDLRSQIGQIEKLLQEITPWEEERITKIRERILNNIQELGTNIDIDKNRFEQEIIFYMEKLDVNEEKVRLANHLKYFMEILEQDEPVGKKLGFVSQEIGREINTLGSKANHAEIQKVVVNMKDVLEKIKEQLLNVL